LEEGTILAARLRLICRTLRMPDKPEPTASWGFCESSERRSIYHFSVAAQRNSYRAAKAALMTGRP
jgi:hypothetical protein